MFKKMFITAAAAAAVSVPLAGVAWADTPSDPGATDNGIGKGGIPQKFGTFADTGLTAKQPGTPSPNPSGDPTPPGSVYIKPLTQLPGNIPSAAGAFEVQIWSAYTLADGTVVSSDPSDWTNVTPGLALKPLTPGCDKGRSGVPGEVQCVG
jgi:hypothetical protein